MKKVFPVAMLGLILPALAASMYCVQQNATWSYTNDSNWTILSEDEDRPIITYWHWFNHPQIETDKVKCIPALPVHQCRHELRTCDDPSELIDFMVEETVTMEVCAKVRGTYQMVQVNFTEHTSCRCIDYKNVINNIPRTIEPPKNLTITFTEEIS